MNAEDEKAELFAEYRKSLLIAGLQTEDEGSLLCPLCWSESPYCDLTLEHYIPGRVGGKDTTLTCRRCNNDHGSQFDSQLSRFQAVADALEGHGMLGTVLNINGKKVAANLHWGKDSKNFHIVGKASNPKCAAGIQEDFEAGQVSKFDFTLLFGYTWDRFQKALLRAAYLVLFQHFGYEYAIEPAVQVIRRRISDPNLDLPQLGTLVCQLKSPKLPEDEPHLLARGRAFDEDFILVIVRLRKITSTHMGVYMPWFGAGADTFFAAMEKCAQELDGKKITIPAGGLYR